MVAERVSPWRAGALAPLLAALRARFPEAQFAYRESPDGSRCYVDVATDAEDDFAVLEVVAGIAVELFLREGIQVHVCPFRRLPATP
ncbi:MAG TPA: hypothetical protein VFB73_03085 [Chloroflexota bacterium]|nr:hypothetical protein [Chloroflexota bacterium]